MKRFPTLPTALVFLIFIFLFKGCRPTESRNFTTYRFLDHLGSQHVVRLPATLSEYEKIPGIHDLGVSSELSDIKKKLIFQDLSLNAILAPPESEFRFEVTVPDGGILELGFGVMEKSWGNPSEGVEFKIVLGQQGRQQTLLAETLVPSRIKEHKRLFKQKIDLSAYAGEKKTISLVTKAAGVVEKARPLPKDIAFWFNPVIYSPRSETLPWDGQECNIILISIDTLRWDRLGCYGYEGDISPHIDSLAADGVQFQHCYVQSNWTLPSHVSLFTSLNSYRHQVYMGNEKMSPSLITIADVLRAHDYFCSGITGGGYVGEQFGFSKGFDLYKSKQYKLHPAKDEAQALWKDTSDWLENNQDKKFFLFLHTYQVHTPYYYHEGITEGFAQGDLSWEQIHLAEFLREQPEKRRYPFTEKEKSDIVALYDGEVKYTDEFLIKPLVQRLKDLNLYDRTMIVFTSDHGEELLDHNSWLHSHTLYDELIRVPLIIKYPASEHAGVKRAPIVRSIDIMPTLLNMVGIDTAPFDLEGASLLDIVQGKEKNNRTFMSDFTRQGSAEVRPRMVCTNQDFFKLIVVRKPSPTKFHLYDIAQDPHESTRIDDTHLDLVKSLFQGILAYYADFKEVPVKSDQVVMDKALEERLKALGYIR